MHMNKIYFCQKLWFHINDYEQSNYEFILIPSQWRLFIGALIPKPMGVIHWYSDTQPMWLFIGTLIPSQWGLFVGILIPKLMGVIHWCSDIETNGGYSLVLWYPTNGGYSLEFWYLTNEGYLLVFWYPNQWGLFIGTLMPNHRDIAWP